MVANVAYTCKCVEGYTGMYCDKKNNSSSPCRTLKCNHGQCKISEHGEPYCECEPNYSGEHCDRGTLGHGAAAFLLYALPCDSYLGVNGK